MENLVNTITAVVFSGALVFGVGYTIKEVHDLVRTETLSQISKGLSSSEALANSLTGEKLDF